MEIKIIAIGNLKENYLKQMEEEYKKRLSPYCRVEIIEVKEEKQGDKLNPALIKEILYKEGMRILKKISNQDYLILLDLSGQQIDSIQFAQFLANKQTQGISRFIFVIGGSYGVSEELIKRANYRWSLSPLTFTHQFTRIIVLEQIYRNFKINNNETYHK